MIMRAKHEGNVMVLELEGHLDFETTVQFRETCKELIDKNGTPRMVISLEKLKFVGSSGINQFIRVLKEFNSLTEKPRYCRLSTEFVRIFRAFQTSRNPFEIFEDESTAKLSFDLPPAPKKPTRVKKVATN